jgi:hypothetical protein
MRARRGGEKDAVALASLMAFAFVLGSLMFLVVFWR